MYKRQECWGAVPSTIVSLIALLSFVIALVTGVFALWGMTGINQLFANKNTYQSTINKGELKRSISGGNPSETEIGASENLEKTNKEIDRFTTTLAKNSKCHLNFLMVGIIFSAILFADSKFDPNSVPPKCILEVDSSGNLVLPIACVK